jgi:hypothetical protein
MRIPEGHYDESNHPCIGTTGADDHTLIPILYICDDFLLASSPDLHTTAPPNTHGSFIVMCEKTKFHGIMLILNSCYSGCYCPSDVYAFLDIIYI